MFNLPLFSSLPSCLSSTRPKDLRLRNPLLVPFAVDRGEVEVGKVPLRGASGREPTRRPDIRKEHQKITNSSHVSRRKRLKSEICILTT
ncbi:hypothetical protein A0H81_01653 [Grifola frondosa]|uniref:Uncharacterized protein n=1 Tax=Grifola frondosa TaxID=5627 RepID=A0A1C7MMA8_GRIFR|nr:hypothetical protein A0H81_01653 [Grifola frondosa]